MSEYRREATEVLNEVILPLRVVPQTLPPLWQGGDCGACVQAGLFGMTVEEVYSILQRGVYETYYEREWTEPRSFSPSCLERSLEVAKKRGFASDIHTQPQVFRRERDYVSRCFGEYPEHHSKHWYEQVTTHLEAGYYAIVMVNMFGKGYYSPQEDGSLRFNRGDHWQIIVGSRELKQVTYRPNGDVLSWSSRYEVLTSCSSTRTPDEEWTEAAEFIRMKGGFHPYFVRPAASTCEKHPKYGAVNSPRVVCDTCWELYNRKWGLDAKNRVPRSKL